MIATMGDTEKDLAPGTATLLLQDIHFADDDLSRPLYPTLVNYPEVLDPEVQLDPGIQVGAGLQELQITFVLREGPGVQFTPGPDVPQKVEVRDLTMPDQAPEGVEAHLDDSPLRCTLTWKRLSDVPRVRAFHIFCQKVDPHIEEIVFGGLFLAILETPRGGLGAQPVNRDVQMTDLAHFALIGVDDQGRPLYDIFKDYSRLISMDADLEIEPTYRVHRGRRNSFEMELKLPLADTNDLIFNRMDKFVPSIARDDFELSFPTPTRCHFSWNPQGAGSDTIGSVATFDLGVDPTRLLEEVRWFLDRLSKEFRLMLSEDRKRELMLIFRLITSVDPTIIEPPRCVDGICAN